MDILKEILTIINHFLIIYKCLLLQYIIYCSTLLCVLWQQVYIPLKMINGKIETSGIDPKRLSELFSP